MISPFDLTYLEDAFQGNRDGNNITLNAVADPFVTGMGLQRRPNPTISHILAMYVF